jgi:pimeloyl-ACP methyl ester carboxylesterase
MAGDLLSTWDQPLLARHATGLAEFARVLMLDKRGTGLSDRVRDVPTLETRMDDIRAVMDAAGSERAILWSGHEGSRSAILFAGTYPERTAGLVLLEPSVRGRPRPTIPGRRPRTNGAAAWPRSERAGDSGTSSRPSSVTGRRQSGTTRASRTGSSSTCAVA